MRSGGEGSVKARPEWALAAFSILVPAPPPPPSWLKCPQQLHPNAIHITKDLKAFFAPNVHKTRQFVVF